MSGADIRRPLSEHVQFAAVYSFVRSGLLSTPNNAKVHYNYANLQADVGNVSLAVEHYRTAIL